MGKTTRILFDPINCVAPFVLVCLLVFSCVKFIGIVHVYSNSAWFYSILFCWQVRTKDHTFDSVPHLISYHRSKNFPIISQESVLYLVRPISNNYTNCWPVKTVETNQKDMWSIEPLPNCLLGCLELSIFRIQINILNLSFMLKYWQWKDA